QPDEDDRGGDGRAGEQPGRPAEASPGRDHAAISFSMAARSLRRPSGTETAPLTILVIQSMCTVRASRPRAPGQIVSLVRPPSICACAASLPGRTGMSLVVTLR